MASSTLYIANLTTSFWEIQYRVPAESGLLSRKLTAQRIGPQMQQRVHEEAPLPVLEGIIDQFRPYGIKPIEEVVRTKDYVGLAYSLGKPMNLDRLEYAVDHNRTVLTEEAEDRREGVALAIADTIDAHADEALRNGVPANLAQRPTQVAIEELEDSDNPKFARAVRVDRASQPSSDARRPRRSRKAA